MTYFGSAKDDEDVDEEEDEEEEEDIASIAPASCQSTPRKSKGPNKCIANGHGTYTPETHHPWYGKSVWITTNTHTLLLINFI